jgi:3-oxoacyl-[acyl-carrier protein] reductase
VNVERSSGVLFPRSHPDASALRGVAYGVVLLSKAMAIELAPYNVCVNSVCPGYILTDPAAEGGMFEEEIGEYTSKIPMDRYGRAEEMAGAFAFLGSDEASFIAGTELGSGRGPVNVPQHHKQLGR